MIHDTRSLMAVATAIGLALTLAVPAAANEIYRWVDDDGVVHFGDRPDHERAEPLTVRTAPPTPAQVPEQPPADSAAAEGPAASDELFAAPPEDEVEAARRANCEIADERYERMSRAPRLYREGPDGERLYLEDDEVEAALSEAREAVEEWCS